MNQPTSLRQRIPLRHRTRASVTLTLVLGTMAALALVGIMVLDTKGADIGQCLAKSLGDLWRMFTSPIMKHFSLEEALYAMLVTLCLSFLTTLIGAVIALFLGLLAARNLSNNSVSTVIKAFVAVIRAIPTVLWVLIFAIGAGLGSVAAIVGMSFHTVGYLLKAYSETFEEIDHGVIEALRAGGASWWQVVFQAVLPSSMGLILSWTFIRFEINFTTAVAMGAAAGAGGIGFDLFMAAHHYLVLEEVGSITWLILICAVVLEVIATRLKNSQRIHA